MTKPIEGVSYSFYSRFNSLSDAKFEAKNFQGTRRHAYYTIVKEKGCAYWDVRVSNIEL